VLGLCTVLFAIAILGERVMGMFGTLADPSGLFKRVLAVLFILVGLAVMTGYDKKLQTRILDAGYFDVTQVEQRLLNTIAPQKDADIPAGNIIKKDMEVVKEIKSVVPAPPVSPAQDNFPPEVRGASGYLNTDTPVTFAALRAERKVVLVHIWTYSCINCQRTVPYIVEWYTKYKDQGLEVVGIHTPEFSFEHDPKNVTAELARYGITYPQVLDNDYTMFRAFNNNYWPRRYVLSRDGAIVYDKIGEGDYAGNEEVIRRELAKP
jgi:thiol-disulfide isomerase/thioredoxin